METMTAMLDLASLNDSIEELLQEATQLHHSLDIICNHASDDTSSQLVVQLRDSWKSLRSIVQRLEDQPLTASIDASIVSVAYCCRIVGQDLLTHLERVDFTRALDKSFLCVQWPSQDVKALGDRLDELSSHWYSIRPIQQ